jgi:hypothetical protein
MNEKVMTFGLLSEKYTMAKIIWVEDVFLNEYSTNMRSHRVYTVHTVRGEDVHCCSIFIHTSLL